MNILSFKKIDSTNTYAKKRIEELNDKTIISADLQTAGRGRFTRSWTDLGSENIYMSIIIKPNFAMPEHIFGCNVESKSKSVPKLCNGIPEVFSNLTQYLAVKLCFQLEQLGLKPQIKWPNDVLLNDKKVSGILAESVFKGGQLKGIVLGIGINLNASLENLQNIDRPATSLNLELEQDIDKESFMMNLLNSFFNDYDSFIANGFKSIKDDYIKRANFLEKNLKVSVFNVEKEGFSIDVSDNGSLVLKLKDGSIEKLNMGEIV